jgi:hypothetical protein
MPSTIIRSRAHRARLALTALALAGCALPLAACNNAGEGALSGAALGAGGGAIIGSMFGKAGKGAIIGGAAGGLGGAVLGDQNSRRPSGYSGTGGW